MRFIAALLIIISLSLNAQNKDSITIKNISNEILMNGKCYSDLEFLCKKIGGRISGSPQAAAAVEYTFQLMKKYGFDTVYLQECMVPKWVRGEKESAKIISTKTYNEVEVSVCAIGGSVATHENGLNAEIVEIKSWDELHKKGKAGELKGKIVFYNRAFDNTFVMPFDAYGKAVDQRVRGASEAAKYDAIACVVRSMTGSIDKFPHTGTLHYDPQIKKIPACAISTYDAELLSKTLAFDPALKFYLKMNCITLPDVKSYNVIGEIRGSEFPDEIIVVGGHLDSWDNGEGAHDDGAGCVQSIEVLRAFKALGIKPKRTIRAVMYMNEENGGKGGDKYAEEAIKEKKKHILAIESDAGGFSPRGFATDMNEEKKNKIISWKPLFLPYGIYDFERKGSGSDIQELGKAGVPLAGLRPDPQRYFVYHHTEIDTFDKINERELKMGALAMAILVYLASEYGL